MSFPTINLKATNVVISPGLASLVDQKFETLEKVLPKGETDVSCEVELEKLSEHQTGKIYRVEANLYVSGKLYRSETTEEQIEKAVDVVRDDLKREIQRATGKRQSLIKRGGQAFKDMMRFGR